MFRLAALAGACLTLAATAGSAAPATGGEPFFVGFADDLPKEIGSAAVTPAADSRPKWLCEMEAMRSEMPITPA